MVIGSGFVWYKTIQIDARLPSLVGVNYRRLESLLQQEQWAAADRETFDRMLEVADRQSQGWLSAEDVKQFACEDLATINRLWQIYSDRRFGFTIQARIWEIAGGQPGVYDRQVALKAGEILGWTREGDPEAWKSYDELTFKADAPVGHLPATTGNGVSGGVWGGVATLAGRVATCADAIDALPESLRQRAMREVESTQAAIREGYRNCEGCNLAGADLQGLDLAFSRLAFADLRGANLQGTILGAADLSYADLRGANLTGAVLRQANLAGAVFDDANLNQADFHCGAGTCTYLWGASFRRANLTQANLACLDCSVVGEQQGLENVNLAGANLTGANLEGSRLEGVNLCGAVLPDGVRSQQGCR